VRNNRFFVYSVFFSLLGVNGVDRACVNTCAAVDAGIGINDTFSALFADGVDRTGVLTGSTVGAIISNCMSHNITSL